MMSLNVIIAIASVITAATADGGVGDADIGDGMVGTCTLAGDGWHTATSSHHYLYSNHATCLLLCHHSRATKGSASLLCQRASQRSARMTS